MAGEWPVKSIADCASSEPYSTQIGPFGKALMADEYTESGVPVLRGVNVNRGRFHDDDFVFIDEDTADRLSKFESYPGDVLLVHKGTLGPIGLMPTKRRYARYIMGNSMMRVRCDPAKLLPEYLYYWLSSPWGQHYLFSRVSQVGVPQIQTPLTTLRQAALPVPPLAEQRAIGHILGTLDDKIELNRRMNETLEAMARALFKSWFVDFDPVRAKMEGRDPGLPKPLANLFPARLVNSELGEIPEGWEVGTLADFSALNPEAWSKETRPTLINYVDLSNTKWGRIEAVTAYAQQDAPSRAQRVLRPRDTIVGTVRPGNRSYAFISEDRLTGSTGFAVLRPLRLECAEFVYFAATAAGNIEGLSHLADGGAYPAVRPEVVAATQVVRPSLEVLEKFSRVARPLLAKMAENERESRTLAALRDTLLPKLISGELRVKNGERFVREAV
jgi:type I restriction enzyme S subunit